MRNIFEQYVHPENRLTHALATTLAEDRELLTRFVRWGADRSISPRQSLEILEQSLPGEPEPDEEEAAQRGLPDAWVHDNGDWALIIESKVAATPTIRQLRRHYHTALRRGFADVTVLLLGTREPSSPLPDYCRFRPWSELYTFLREEACRSEWAMRSSKYFEVAEQRMVAQGYLKEGSLTTFTGIPFDADNPYNYLEAKRLLRLAMEELRADNRLHKQLGIDLQSPGRPAITRANVSGVWDYLQLKEARGATNFASYPHFTFSLWQQQAFAALILPNAMKPVFRRRLLDRGPDGLLELFQSTFEGLESRLRRVPGAIPWVTITQRHFKSQRSRPTLDARLDFDLRTFFPSPYKTWSDAPRIKPEPSWLQIVYPALNNRRANIQVAVGAAFPYESSPATRNRDILMYAADAWLACKPLLRGMIS